MTTNINAVLGDMNQNAMLTAAEVESLIAGTDLGNKWKASTNTTAKEAALIESWQLFNLFDYIGEPAVTGQPWKLPTRQTNPNSGALSGMSYTMANNGSTSTVMRTSLIVRLVNQNMIVGGTVMVTNPMAPTNMFLQCCKITNYDRLTGEFTLASPGFPSIPNYQIAILFALPMDFRRAGAMDAAWRLQNQSHSDISERAHVGARALEDIPGLGGSLDDVGPRAQLYSVSYQMISRWFVSSSLRIRRGL